MADPRRLSEEGANAFEAKILAAGRKDALSRRSRLRITVALALGVLLPMLSVHAAKAYLAGALRSWSGALLFRAAVGGTLGAAALWAGAEFSRSDPKAADRPDAATTRTRAPALPPAPTPSASVEAPLGSPLAAPASATVRAPSSPRRSSAGRGVDSLVEELSALERARRSFASGDAKGSLRLLDEYARRFPRPQLGSEAGMLRIEALVVNGERASATRLARAALARQPNGPHARRLRSLVAEAEGAAKAP